MTSREAYKKTPRPEAGRGDIQTVERRDYFSPIAGLYSVSEMPELHELPPFDEYER